MTGAGRTQVALAAGAGMLLLSVHVLRSRLAVIRIRAGSSMTRAADNGRLLVRRTTRVRRSNAVVFRNPVPFGDGDDALAWLVKRVSALPGDAVPPDVREIVGAPDGGLGAAGSLIVRGDAAAPRTPASVAPGVPAGRGVSPARLPRPLLNPLLTAASTGARIPRTAALHVCPAGVARARRALPVRAVDAGARGRFVEVVEEDQADRRSGVGGGRVGREGRGRRRGGREAEGAEHGDEEAPSGAAPDRRAGGFTHPPASAPARSRR